MKFKLCEVNKDSFDKLPPNAVDNSGVGVHFMSAYIKPMKVVLEDGTKITCRRRGLKLTLAIGPEKGIGLMRRLEVSKDPKVMIQAALKEAADNIGYTFSVENNIMYLEKN